MGARARFLSRCIRVSLNCRMPCSIGAGSIVTVQESILAYWFHGRGLSVAVGLQIGLSRAASFLSSGTVREIADHTGWYGYAFWVSSAICFFSWTMTIIYIAMVKYVMTHEDPVRSLAVSWASALTLPFGDHQAITAKLKSKHDFKLRDMLHLSTSLWIIVFLSFAFGMVWGPFLHIIAYVERVSMAVCVAHAAARQTAIFSMSATDTTKRTLRGSLASRKLCPFFWRRSWAPSSTSLASAHTSVRALAVACLQ